MYSLEEKGVIPASGEMIQNCSKDKIGELH